MGQTQDGDSVTSQKADFKNDVFYGIFWNVEQAKE